MRWFLGFCILLAMGTVAFGINDDLGLDIEEPVAVIDSTVVDISDTLITDTDSTNVVP